MSNALGTIVPVKEVIRIAHARGIPVLVDGSQAAVHLAVDVQDLDCDFYVFTGHKTYGPTGIGVLYGKPEHLERMPPYQGGGEMIGEVTIEAHHLRRAAAPLRGRHAGHRPGHRPRRGARLHDGRRPRQHRRPRGELSHYATQRLREINSLTHFRPRQGQGRASSPSTWTGPTPTTSRPIIDRYGVAVRAGTHCAQPLLARFGVTATCRASFAMYNTTRGSRRLAEALNAAQRCSLRSTDRWTTETRYDSEVEPRASAESRPAGDRARSRSDELEPLTDDIVAALKTVYDPEIPVDIYELGLIYKVDIDDDRNVAIDMTLTAPGCPVAGDMPGWVENAVGGGGVGAGQGQPGVRSAVGSSPHVGRGARCAEYVVEGRT